MFGKILIVLLSILVVVPHLIDLDNRAKIISPNGKVEKEKEYIPKEITLESIFSNNHDFINEIPKDKKITLIATGDIIPARVVNIQVTTFNNFLWPYEKVAESLKSADITLIDLETPIMKSCPLINEGFKFCGSDRNVEGLVFSGVDIASLANNHSGNFGIEGLLETEKILNDNNILVFGINKGPTYMNVKGIKFAFLGYNDIGAEEQGISWASEEKIKSEIFEARQNADLVIVEYHWGIEYRDQPDDRQKYLAHFTIDAGADLVIGNHPHWVQPIEFYKGKLITYAHGNFVFDQEWSLKTKQGVLGKYTFYGKDLVDVEYFPVLIENYGQPRFLEGQEGMVILENMKRQSEILSVN